MYIWQSPDLKIKSPKYFSVRIPTKTYLRKFLEFELGKEVIAPGNHPVQKFFYIALEKKFYRYQFNSITTAYNDQLTVLVSVFTFYNLGNSISPTNVVILNNYIESLFDQALYRHMMEYYNNYRFMNSVLQELHDSGIAHLTKDQRRRWIQVPRYKDALLKFAEQLKMDVEVDITFENLKKMEYRARKRFEAGEINFLQTVPTLFDGDLTLEFQPVSDFSYATKEQ